MILSAIAFIGGLVILGVKVLWPNSNKKSPSSSQGGDTNSGLFSGQNRNSEDIRGVGHAPSEKQNIPTENVEQEKVRFENEQQNSPLKKEESSVKVLDSEATNNNDHLVAQGNEGIDTKCSSSKTEARISEELEAVGETQAKELFTEFTNKHVNIALPKTKVARDNLSFEAASGVMDAVRDLPVYFNNDLQNALESEDFLSLRRLQIIFPELKRVVKFFKGVMTFGNTFDEVLLDAMWCMLKFRCFTVGKPKNAFEYTVEESAPKFDEIEASFKSIEDVVQRAVNCGSIKTDITDLRIAYYPFFYRVSLERLLISSYAKLQLTPIIQEILAEYSKRGFSKCNIKSTHSAPIDFSKSENEILQQFQEFYNPNSHALPMSEYLSTKKPRPVIRNDLSCHAIASYQCLATFYPLVMRNIRPLSSGESYPPRFQKILQALKELDTESSTPFEMRKSIKFLNWSDPLMSINELLNNPEFWPYLNSYSLAGVINNAELFRKIDVVYRHNARYIPLSSPKCFYTSIGYLVIMIFTFSCNLEPEINVFDPVLGKPVKFVCHAITLFSNLHYTALVKRGSIWYHCNDTSIVPFPEADLPVTKEKREKLGKHLHNAIYLRDTSDIRS